MREVLMVAVLVLCGTVTAVDPVPQPLPITDYVAIDVETEKSVVKSFIADDAANGRYMIVIYVDMIVVGDRQLCVTVYDENTGLVTWANKEGAMAGPVNVVAGNGTSIFEYTVAKNTPWGRAIADGSFDQASVNVNLMSGLTCTASDSAWVYK